MERELVLQNHKYANLLKAKEEECKFWQNKVTLELMVVFRAEFEAQDYGVRGRGQREAK